MRLRGGWDGGVAGRQPSTLRPRREAIAPDAGREFLFEASALLAASLDHRATLAEVAQRAVPRFADWCSFRLAEEQPADVDARLGPAAVLRSGRPELHPRLLPPALPAFAREAERARGPGLRQVEPRSAMSVPVTARGRTLGVLTFLAGEPGRYGRHDLAMAQALAHLAALAVDNDRLHEQAQEAVRAREEVVAMVSHDLKNPLNAILMSSGLLRRSAEDPERVRHHADVIERAVGRMHELIRDLLDLARLEGGRFTLERGAHALGALVEEALTLLQPLAQDKGVALDAEPPPGPAVARCDRDRVLQVLSNLVGNAIAFTPRGGRVVVRWRVSGPEVVTAVADTGPGIAEEDQRHVFERFWKSRSTGQGTGLGLCIAQGIVGAHGGRIWVESRRGEGATFLFTLPAGDAGQASAPP